MAETERRLDARLLCAITAAGLMSFSGVVVETAMNVTFPSLMREFSISTSLVQWVTTGYLLVSALIIPASAFLKRRFPTRVLFVAAITLFISGTLLAAWSPVFLFLVLGRILQGMATGIALPMMFNIILEEVPAKYLGLMIGVGNLITSIAPAVGPPFGGVIVSYFGWRMIFVFLMPVLVISAVLGITCIRQAGDLEHTSFNLPLFVILAAAFTSFIFAISLAGTYGWLSVPVIILFCICVPSLVLFYKLSLGSAKPLLRVEVFHCEPFTLSTFGDFLLLFICLGYGFIIPNYSQIVSGSPASVAGLLLLPGCTLGALLAPVGGRLLDKFGAKRPILVGNVAILLSALCFALYPGEISSTAFVAIYVLFTFGQGFSQGTIMANGLRQLPEHLQSDGNAAITTMTQLAAGAGTAVVATIIATAQAADSAHFAHATMIGCQHGFYVIAFCAFMVLMSSLRVFYLLGKKRAAEF